MLMIGFLFMLSMIFMPVSNSVTYFMMISFLTYIGSVFIWPALFKISMDINPEAEGTNSAIINSLRFTGYAMVGPFYLFIGLPLIYACVFVFNLLAILMVFVLIRLKIG
jgi:hypothetical protein